MLFAKVNKISVHIILVQFNTSLSKNYVAHSIAAVCMIEFEKKKQICLYSLRSLCYEIRRSTRIFP